MVYSEYCVPHGDPQDRAGQSSETATALARGNQCPKLCDSRSRRGRLALHSAHYLHLCGLTMKKSSYRILFSTTFVALAGTLSAQTPQNLAENGSVPASASTTAQQWDAKPLGVYDVDLASADADCRARITVSERQGKLVAMVWPRDDREGQMMDATVLGTELVLTGTTAGGPMEISVERRGDKLSGKWTLGTRHGSLTGEALR